MKIVVISGSPRGEKSQTRLLAEKLLSAAGSAGAQTELFDLGKARITFCRACEVCHTGPECVLPDDVKGILATILGADGIVLATPVYLNQVTAQLKALLDRTSHFVHCLRLSGKYTVSVTTSGGGGGADVKAYLRSYSFSVGAQFVGGVDARVPLTDAHLAEAEKLGHTLAAAIAQKRQFPVQLRIIEERRRYFGRIIEFHRGNWPYEYEYWRKQGWL
jgi:multimeric flavodoxin WrbA